MIFVPLTRAAAVELRETGELVAATTAFAATQELIAAHGYSDEELEDADFAAQSYAAIADLQQGSDQRIVLSADVPPRTVERRDLDAAYGRVTVSALRWVDVTAVFVDDPAAAGAVADAVAAIDALGEQERGDLDVVLALPAVRALDGHDLLWYDPAESW